MNKTPELKHNDFTLMQYQDLIDGNGLYVEPVELMDEEDQDYLGWYNAAVDKANKAVQLLGGAEDIFTIQQVVDVLEQLLEDMPVVGEDRYNNLVNKTYDEAMRNIIYALRDVEYGNCAYDVANKRLDYTVELIPA